MRVVIDTNVIVSAFMARAATSSPLAILDALREGRFEIAVSSTIIDEYRDVLSLPAFSRRHGLSSIEVFTEVQILSRNAFHVDPHDPGTQISRDRDDDVFLACAVAASADCIVSGDNDLLVLGSYKGIPILPPAVFLSILKSGTRL